MAKKIYKAFTINVRTVPPSVRISPMSFGAYHLRMRPPLTADNARRGIGVALLNDMHQITCAPCAFYHIMVAYGNNKKTPKMGAFLLNLII